MLSRIESIDVEVLGVFDIVEFFITITLIVILALSKNIQLLYLIGSL